MIVGRRHTRALADLSREHLDPLAAMDRAWWSLEEALTLRRFIVRPHSTLDWRLRRDLPYCLQTTRTAGVQILVNRNYKPVGSTQFDGSPWIAYDDYPNLHVRLSREEIEAISVPGHAGWLFHDGNAPWLGREHAKAYCHRLRALRDLIEANSPLSDIRAIELSP